MTHSWISVEDSLPDSVSQEYWVYGSDGVTIGTCYHTLTSKGTVWADVYGDFDGMRDDTIYDVTHWQPMDKPNAPK